MSTFLDGPAKGKSFLLKRAPVMLRVVQNKSGEWDALDQLDDEPSADEKIFVYQITGEPSRVHVCRSPRNQSGWFTIGEYRYFEPQPSDDQVRSTESWNAWCDDLQKRIQAGEIPDPIKKGN